MISDQAVLWLLDHAEDVVEFAWAIEEAHERGLITPYTVY